MNVISAAVELDCFIFSKIKYYSLSKCNRAYYDDKCLMIVDCIIINIEYRFYYDMDVQINRLNHSRTPLRGILRRIWYKTKRRTVCSVLILNMDLIYQQWPIRYRANFHEVESARKNLLGTLPSYMEEVQLELQAKAANT